MSKITDSLSRLLRRSRPRDLRRDLREQSTEEYWRFREKELSRGTWIYRLWDGIETETQGAKALFEVVRSVIPSLEAFVVGCLVLAAVLALEAYMLASYPGLPIAPQGDSAPPLGAFPTLAVQISASLLGFYLASVSIVLGRSYDDVSADVRELVLMSTRTKIHLAFIGTAIGAGLTLVVLHSFEYSYGYLTVGLYVLLVALSGYAFVQLAFGAFNLFDPIRLSNEPLQTLFRAIDRIDSKGFRGDEPTLRDTAQRADTSLRVLAELMNLTRKRSSVDTTTLVKMVEDLLENVSEYAQKKHRLAPTSAWFLPEPVYPRWVETDPLQVSNALKASTPLQPKMEPRTDWLERRASKLVSAALSSCIAVNNRAAALEITALVASTVRVLGRCYHINDAISMSEIVRDLCWDVQKENAAAIAAASEPPKLLASLLLGWQEAVRSWPEEIRSSVYETDWESRRTRSVQIRGTSRVWTAAQDLLSEVQAELDIEGQRKTPDWYLRLKLADESILSLREFGAQLPDILRSFTLPEFTQSSPVLEAAAGEQALQALARAMPIADAISESVKGLESLRMGNESQPTEGLDNLGERIRALRAPVLERIAEAVTDLRPVRSQSEPDLFGSAWYALVYYTEDAIATGDEELVGRVFPRIIFATTTLENYILSTYGPPTYQYSSANYDPLMDLLELSGLAVVYASLRGDQSDDPVRRAWGNYFDACQEPEEFAKLILNMLDLGALSLPAETIWRTEWGMRLSREVVRAGYARPRLNPFEEAPEWKAPPLIKMLGIGEDLPSVDLAPREISAAEIIAPQSSESDEQLRGRAGLREYYDMRDRYDLSDTSGEEPPNSGAKDSEDFL